MLNRAKKREIIDKIKQKLKESQITFLCNFSGISAQKQRELKKECQKNKIEIFVVRKTLLKKAFEEENIKFPKVKGSIIVALGKDEALAPKIFFEFMQKKLEPKKEKLDFFGGISKEKKTYKIISPEDLIFLAKIPSKEELLKKLIFLIKLPMINLIGIFKDNFKKLVFLLKAIQ